MTVSRAAPRRLPYPTLLAFAHELAEASGPKVLREFRRAGPVSDKGGAFGFDPVTAADRGAEKAIAALIAARYPDHGLLGEEYGERSAASRYRWVVDPIDGTRAFIMGSPLWGTLIGLLDDGAPHLGLMDQPFTGERFWAAKRAAYRRQGQGKPRRLTTRPCARLEDAVLTTTDPHYFTTADEAARFQELRGLARMTRYGGDCYGYCLLAAGFIDAVVESGLKPYDIVALIPIIERAGGRVTTWDGGPATRGGRILATGDKRLHDVLVRRLSG
jgi:histidinol phosphatase-like enzyme (inositol monophosphatase family)